jgi:NADH dehydrogenase FAD-containing subunit
MKIVILGCGFAGLEAAKELRNRSKEIEIAMIDRRTRFEYLAALPEILSGKVSPAELSADLNKFAASIDANFINAEVVDIDFSKDRYRGRRHPV